MNGKVKVSIFAYSTALIAFGVLQFIFGLVLVGRPPVWLSEQLIIAYATGIMFIAIGLCTIINWQPKWGLVFVGCFVVLLAGLPNMYGAITRLDYGFLLTSTGKALTLGSGALLVASYFVVHPEEHTRKVDEWILLLSQTCRYFTSFFVIASGVQHFLFADFVKQLIPEWIPGGLFWVYFSGVALVAAGIGIITNIKLQVASSLASAMIFSWVLLLHLPRAIANPTQNEWVAVFEAISFGSILLLLSLKSSPGK